MPKVSDDYLAGRQDQVIEAAIRCFARGGFHATGMAEIIRESGLSAGSVYRYYKSKDELIAAIIERLLIELQEHLIHITADIETPGEMLSRAIEFASSRFTTAENLHPRLLPQVWTEALRNPAVFSLVRQKYSRIIDHFEGVLSGLQASGKLNPVLNPSALAHLMLASVQGYILQKLLMNQELDTAAYIRTAQQIFDGDTRSQAQLS